MEPNLYKIKEARSEDNSIINIIELNPDHSIYKGHFPGQPVLPGVCSILIIKECIQECLQKKICFKTIRECKFLSPIIPNKENSYTIASSLNNNILISNIIEGNKIILKLKAVIE